MSATSRCSLEKAISSERDEILLLVRAWWGGGARGGVRRRGTGEVRRRGKARYLGAISARSRLLELGRELRLHHLPADAPVVRVAVQRLAHLLQLRARARRRRAGSGALACLAPAWVGRLGAAEVGPEGALGVGRLRGLERLAVGGGVRHVQPLVDGRLLLTPRLLLGPARAAARGGAPVLARRARGAAHLGLVREGGAVLLLVLRAQRLQQW